MPRTYSTFVLALNFLPPDGPPLGFRVRSGGYCKQKLQAFFSFEAVTSSVMASCIGARLFHEFDMCSTITSNMVTLYHSHIIFFDNNSNNNNNNLTSRKSAISYNDIQMRFT